MAVVVAVARGAAASMASYLMTIGRGMSVPSQSCTSDKRFIAVRHADCCCFPVQNQSPLAWLRAIAEREGHRSLRNPARGHWGWAGRASSRGVRAGSSQCAQQTRRSLSQGLTSQPFRLVSRSQVSRRNQIERLRVKEYQ